MNIPGFSILEKIGEGGMAVVWKAHQVSLDRMVAIKILRPDMAADKTEVIEFISEARSAAKIKHPNIVQVYDVAEAGGRCYFVMEYVAGATVAQILKKQGRIPQKEAIKIARCVADALQNAWDTAGIIHRDIKPDNIMIDSDGTVKVADLGLAKMVDPATLSAKIQAGTIEGTPNYMSPEQAQCSTKQDFRTDVYSLGATLYHMVTGNMPFAGLGAMQVIQKHVDGMLPNPTSITPAVTQATSSLISRMMMKKPEDRFESWEDTITGLKRAAAGRVILSTQRSSALSTIEPLKQRPTRSAVQQRKTNVPVAPVTPVWVHITALLVLSLWWFGLGHMLTRLPSPAAYYAPPIRTTRQPAPQRPRPTSTAQTPGRNQTAPEQSGDASTDTAVDDDDSNMAAVKAALAQHLCAREFTLANAVIDNELEYAYSPDAESELKLIKGMVDDASRLDSAVESAFRKRIGEEVTIVHGGNERRVKLRGVSGGEITATMDVKIGSGSGTRTVTFTVSQLDPLERSKWLGNPTTVADHVRKFILHFEAGDMETARALAAKCGHMSDAFASLAGDN